MSVLTRTIVLLTISNIFMTFAWYAHLRNLQDRKWYVAALLSWGLALFGNGALQGAGTLLPTGAHSVGLSRK